MDGREKVNKAAGRCAPANLSKSFIGAPPGGFRADEPRNLRGSPYVRVAV